MKKIKTSVSILLMLIIYSSPVLSKEINGSATYNYTSIGEYELNKEVIRSNAMRLACKNAFKKYVRGLDKATKKNYKKVKDEIEGNLSDYMSCDLIVDENNIKDKQSLAIVVKAIINTDDVEITIDGSSKIADEGSDRTIAILMIVRKTTGGNIKDGRVRTVQRDTGTVSTSTSSDSQTESDASYSKQGNKSSDTNQIEAIDDNSVISSSNTDTSESGDFKGNTSQTKDGSDTKTTTTTNISESGGGRIVSAAKFKYEIADGLEEAIMSGMLESFEDNGFDVQSLDNYEDSVIDLYEEIQVSYVESNRISKKLTKRIKKAFVDEGDTNCYITGSFDVGLRETDPATGNLLKNVLVKSAKMECFYAKKEGGKKKWRRVASVSGVQAKGFGTTEPEAEQNAIEKCAKKVGKKLLNKVNAKGFN